MSRLGLGLALTRRRRTGFDPASLGSLAAHWAKGAGLSQDDAGVTPAAADGDAVGRWADASGNARHLKQSTAASKGTLRANQRDGGLAVEFDGSADYLGTGNTTALNYEYNQPFTIAAWIRPANATQDNVWFLAKMALATTFRGYGLSLQGSGSVTPNAVRFTIRSDNGAGKLITATTANGVWAANTWVHVAFTYSGSGTLAGCVLYLNGSAQAKNGSTDALAAGTIQSGTNFNLVGRDGGNSPLNGRIDQAAAFDKALSAAEVLQLYQGT